MLLNSVWQWWEILQGWLIRTGTSNCSKRGVGYNSMAHESGEEAALEWADALQSREMRVMDAFWGA